MALRIGGRDVGTIFGAFFKRQHWTAAKNMLTVYRHPLNIFRRYLSGTGTYPDKIEVRTPSGPILLNVYTHHDILTINEIFCRLDYRATAEDTVVVDFGSNIGISAAYFLTRSATVRAFLFEPLPTNTARLRENLAAYAGRYELVEKAVGMADGEVTFGWEDSGRYGGVGVETGNYITVPCVDSNSVLQAIVDSCGRIDVLKIDIETMEEAVTARLPLELASKIGKIYVEWKFATNPLERTHRMTQYGSVAQFVRLGAGQV